jgi:hypothetical protein
MKQWPSARNVSLNRFIGENTQGHLAKPLGSIEQKIWCITFHICHNPTDFGWRPALLPNEFAYHSGVAQGTTWRLCRR